jgi:hypothetical protein
MAESTRGVQEYVARTLPSASKLDVYEFFCVLIQFDYDRARLRLTAVGR